MRMGLTNPVRGFRADQRGVAALEFALILPVILVLLIGAAGVGELVIAYRRVNQVAESIVRSANALITQPTDTTAGTLTSAGVTNLQKIGQLNLDVAGSTQISVFRYVKSAAGQLQLTNSWTVSGSALATPTPSAQLTSSLNTGQTALIGDVCYVYHSQLDPLVDGFVLCSAYAYSANV